jgi:hypothetical protein
MASLAPLGGAGAGDVIPRAAGAGSVGGPHW